MYTPRCLYINKRGMASFAQREFTVLSVVVSDTDLITLYARWVTVPIWKRRLYLLVVTTSASLSTIFAFKCKALWRPSGIHWCQWKKNWSTRESLHCIWPSLLDMSMYIIFEMCTTNSHEQFYICFSYSKNYRCITCVVFFKFNFL